MGVISFRALALAAVLSFLASAVTPAVAVEQLRRSGRWMVDGYGRVVLLHGVNAVWKISPYAPPDTAAGFTAADAQWLADNGFNSVRLGVLFAGVMPQAGVVDTGYLDAIDRVVQLLAAKKIWILLDFHQDLFSERYQGEGFPDWAADDDGLPHVISFGFPGNYFTPECMRAFDNFWANKNGLWDHYRDAWKAVASRWKGQPYLMGYDLMNEPWPGMDWPTCANPVGCPLHDTLKVQAMQEHVRAGIREIDPDNIVWFEPNVIFNSGAKSGLGLVVPIVDANLGLSWHNYCLPAGVVHAQGGTDFPGCEQWHRIPFDNAVETIDRIQSTALVTEFGASDDLADLRQVTSQADEYLTGWQYWHYKEWDDPTTESQESGGQGLFTEDDDLTTLKAAKADVLIRPYPQATAGTPQSLRFDPATRRFAYGYAPDASGRKTEIFVPARQYPGGYVTVVSGASVDPSSTPERLKLVASPGAAAVTVEILPSP